MTAYVAPNTSELDEDHVREALDFLIAVEPVPPPETRNDYEVATEPVRSQITTATATATATATLRRFAEQARPKSPERMQVNYYGFTNDPRYLISEDVLAVVRGGHPEAWDGVGPWRR